MRRKAAEIEFLTELTSIKIFDTRGSNSIEALIPTTLPILEKLEELSITGFEGILPGATLGRLSHLKILDLWSLRFTVQPFPSELLQLTSIEHLYLYLLK